VAALVAVLVAAAGLGGVAVHRAPLAQNTASPPPAPPAVPVTTVSVTRQDVPVLLRNIGSVQAFQSVLVRARVDGTLDKIFFQEGQDAKPGDKLAEIDPRPYAAALAQAQAKKAADHADLANAQADLARYSTLVQKDYASRQQLDTQRSMVNRLQASLAADDAAIATAALNLNFCSITAPIEGRVGIRMVDVGNLIHANDASGIVTITQIRPISVLFTLPQDDLPQIHAAMAHGTLPVLAYTADDKTELSRGELLTTDNAIDQTTGTIRLKAVFANADNRLWPGQFINARLQVGMIQQALTVPSRVVQRGPSGLYAYVVKPDSTVAMQPIETGQDDGELAVVSKGLDDNAQVVVRGQARLQNGTRVAATPAKPSS
jgi:multidrug efflux system membrane fusion protein